MYYSAPIISIFYFMTSQHQVTVTYYMFVYYFSGNLVFGLLLNLTLIHWIDRPIYALINLKNDVRDAEESKYYRINKYLSLFMGQNNMSGQERMSQVSQEVSNDEIQE